ncbi:uncharacterized protein [Pyrus communis]|uniref:uncharacterized protein n=1 Tax=Pyrus communis TaxID=23211 RepID=UPI0035BF3CAA
MMNLAKLDFVALDITRKNFLTWVVDTKIYLEARNLGETIKEENNASSQDRVKTMIFIRHHLDEELKSKYLMIKNLLALWNALRNRYNHQKTMKLCGETIIVEDMLEKTFSTFHDSNMLMQQQYRERGFTEYNQLISMLLVAEQNNELVMKNHQSRPIGYAPFPEVNTDSLEVPRHNSGSSLKIVNCHKGKAYMNNAPRNSEGACHKCGGNGHWANNCHTPKHLVDLYQASIKEKGVETNFLDQAKPIDIPDLVCDLSRQLNTTHLDVSDFIVERGNEVYWSD